MTLLADYTAELHPQGKKVVLRPRGETSLRRLADGFRRAGARPETHRATRTVWLPLESFLETVSDVATMRGDLDFALQAVLERRHVAAARHARARDAVNSIMTTKADALRPDFPRDAALLDDHQIQAVAAAVHDDVLGLCVFDEQGLGKTLVALFAFHLMRRKGLVKRMLVLSPKSMMPEWIADGVRFLPQYRMAMLAGATRAKREALDDDFDVYATNFETAVNLRVALRHKLEERPGGSLLVVDESFYVKNPAALRTDATRELRSAADRCIVLCGTPAPNRPEDIVEQFNIADEGQTFAGVAVPDDHDDAHDVVASTINARGIYLRRLKQDVLPDLPTKTFNRVLVPMAPVQRRAYCELLGEFHTDLLATDEISFRKNTASYLARRAALLQMCSAPQAVLDQYEETPGKIRALDELLYELIAVRGEKVVMWSYYRASVDMVMDRYGEYGAVRYDGAVSDPNERRAAVRAFQEDETTRLFVGNPAAAGAGLTLHRARIAIYESMSNQAAQYLQSLDRIHRRGQTRDVEYLVLLADESLEIPEYSRLRRKEAAAEALLGDRRNPPVTRDALLREASEAAKLVGLALDG